MKFHQITLHITACMSSLFLLLPHQACTLAVSDRLNGSVKKLERKEISNWEIQDIARQITVKILSDNNTIPIPSTGILIDKKAITIGEQQIYLFLVLTNHHIVQNRNANYRVETADGRIYKADLYAEYNSKFGDEIDLDLLYFFSPISYKKAELGDSSTLKNEEKVFVGGFACPESRFCEKESKFIFEPGTALLLKQPLKEHYQIAYTSNTKPGNSGGAVLNKKGKLVAINGQGKYASDDQYKYKGGGNPSREVIDFMRHFAWGIPIDTYKQRFSLKNPLDTVKLPDHAPVIEYVRMRSPSDSAPDNDSKTQETWLNNTNVVGALIIFILICLVIYLGTELRKNKINPRKQDRKDAPPTQDIDNLKDSIDKIHNLLQNNYESPDKLFQRLSSTTNQLETYQYDKLNQLITKLYQYHSQQMTSSINQSVTSQYEHTNKLIEKLISGVINEIHLQNGEIDNIYKFIEKRVFCQDEKKQHQSNQIDEKNNDQLLLSPSTGLNNSPQSPQNLTSQSIESHTTDKGNTDPQSKI